MVRVRVILGKNFSSPMAFEFAKPTWNLTLNPNLPSVFSADALFSLYSPKHLKFAINSLGFGLELRLLWLGLGLELLWLG